VYTDSSINRGLLCIINGIIRYPAESDFILNILDLLNIKTSEEKPKTMPVRGK
jgi:hypothetical protein